MNKKNIISFLLIFILVTACNATKSTPTTPTNTAVPTPVEPTLAAYPAPLPEPTTVKDASYPSPLQGYATPDPAYPAPEQITPTKSGVTIPIVPFKIDKPVKESATEVSGTGPAGVPIVLANVSFNGDTLAETTINPDGTFLFKLTNPLEKNLLIGIYIGDLSKTQWTPEVFSDSGFFGGQSKQVPSIGFFYDTAQVGVN